MNSKASLRPLVELGLTDLEADIYSFLVENSPATGYRIAMAINKPTANTYKALRSLLSKGIVIVENTSPQAFRAVASGVLLDRLEKRFQRMKTLAAAELARIKPAADDEKVYRLHTVEQVFERFREMLAVSEKIVILDLFPRALAELKADIEAAAARGVTVVLKLYQPEPVRGTIAVVHPSGRRLTALWPGIAANGIADGREHLITFLAADQRSVYDAIWSRSTLVSANFHSALLSEITLLSLLEDMNGQGIKRSKTFERLRGVAAKGLPGYATLLSRYQGGRMNAGPRSKTRQRKK